MGPSRIGTEAPSSFSNGSGGGGWKSSREAGASLGGSDHLRSCTELLHRGFLQELLEFHKDACRDGEPTGVKRWGRGSGLQALPAIQQWDLSCHFLFWAGFFSDRFKS